MDGFMSPTSQGLNAGAVLWVALCPSVRLLSWQQRQTWRLSSLLKTFTVIEIRLLACNPTASGGFVVSGMGIMHSDFEHNHLGPAQVPLSQCRDFAITLGVV